MLATYLELLSKSPFPHTNFSLQRAHKFLYFNVQKEGRYIYKICMSLKEEDRYTKCVYLSSSFTLKYKNLWALCKEKFVCGKGDFETLKIFYKGKEHSVSTYKILTLFRTLKSKHFMMQSYWILCWKQHTKISEWA